MEQEENIRKQTNNIKNPKQTKNKTKKQENYDKKKLGEIWTTYRWITEYLEENNNKWRQDFEEYFKNTTKQLETWDKLTRQAKIQIIQENNKREKEGKTKPSDKRTIKKKKKKKTSNNSEAIGQILQRNRKKNKKKNKMPLLK